MNKSLVQQQFGAHAASYAMSSVHAKGASLARLVALVAPQRHWKGLDVATGAGHTAIAFAPQVAGMIASDLTAEMLNEVAEGAASKGLGNIQRVRADAEALPFRDACFDLVTCRIAAHHFPDVATFVAEAWRVLGRGGTFALVDNISPDAESTPGFSEVELQGAARAYNAFEKLRDASHGRCFGMVEWSELLKGRGFELVHKERLPKAMEFDPWVARTGCAASVRTRLREMLTEGPAALTAFLKPHTAEEALWFVLDEAILIARKPL
jgi:ubiquinone/menaquinone biosynthesis C-methylase UbiE